MGEQVVDVDGVLDGWCHGVLQGEGIRTSSGRVRGLGVSLQRGTEAGVLARVDESCMLPAVSAQAVLGSPAVTVKEHQEERTCCIEERDADAANGLVSNAVQLL